MVFFRAVYGLCLSYLLCIMLSPKTEDSIPWWRPTKYLRWFLSLSFWVPFATLSFSFYLMHLQTLFLIKDEIYPKTTFYPGNVEFNATKALIEGACYQGRWAIFGSFEYIFWLIFVITIILSVLSFVYIEKPGIDARVAIKSKFAK